MRTLAVTLAALCLSTAMPSFAEMTNTQKDECVLASRNCMNAVDDIQAQIRKISGEIAKGSSVYTPQELATLDMKLKEVKTLLENLGNK